MFSEKYGKNFPALNKPVSQKDYATACLKILRGRNIVDETYEIKEALQLSCKFMCHISVVALGSKSLYKQKDID